jgi:hypothetical protein
MICSLQTMPGTTGPRGQWTSLAAAAEAGRLDGMWLVQDPRKESEEAVHWANFAC